jgi:hypothetical protein
MIDFGVSTSGGQVFAHLDWETAFDQAAACLAEIIAGSKLTALRLPPGWRR